jgi:hypothetical protein
MKAFSASMFLLVAASVVGCGSGGQGPAKPEETPVVTPEQVQESYTKGMPPEVKKMYDAKMKKGGS